MRIRDPVAADEQDWRRLWSGYNTFYEVRILESVTALTWQRILDPASTIFCRIAMIDDDIAGFSISVIHPSTWTATLVCYLEDLFVAPQLAAEAAGGFWMRTSWIAPKQRGGRGFIGTLARAIRLAPFMTNLPLQMTSSATG